METDKVPSGRPLRVSSSAFYKNTGDPSEGDFKNALGLNVHYYLWLPKEPRKLNELSESNKEERNTTFRGIVIFLHGYESHSLFGWLCKPLPDTFVFHNPANVGYSTSTVLPLQENDGNMWSLCFESSWTAQLLDEGFVVAAFDFIGHGLSESWQEKRASFPSLDYLANDAIQFLSLLPGILKNRVESEMNLVQMQQELPIFMCGTSLGGYVIARTLQVLGKYNEDNGTKGESIKLCGAILLSPLLELSGFENSRLFPMIKFALNLASWLMPHTVIRPHSSGYIYPHMEEYARRDKFTYKEGIRARTAREFLLAPQTVRSNNEMKKINPDWCDSLLLIHNVLDNLAAIGGSLDFFEKVPIQDKWFSSINSYLGANSESGSQVEVSSSKEIRDTLTNAGSSESTNDAAKENEHDEDTDSNLKNSYLLSGNVDKDLLEKLQPYSSSNLHGVDVCHSIATEPGQKAVFKEILRFLKKRALNAN